MANKTTRVALVSPGSAEARASANLAEHRLSGLAEALREVGLESELVLYNDEWAEEARDQLLGSDGVLVWVNPIEQGCDRTVLDGILREVADSGEFVSAHPDVILKMGTKEVLYATRGMSWGCDTHLYSTIEEMRAQLPLRLRDGGARVLKQYRGNGGNGVWKVQRKPGASDTVLVRHALRGSVEQEMLLADFLLLCEGYIEGAGRIIDQEYQERLVDGMVRCYMVGDRVAGFGHQEINALFPAPVGADPTNAPQPGPRLYYGPELPRFQDVRRLMEERWLGELCETLGLERSELPAIWDADLLYGPKTPSGEDTYVLCEINVSSVYPFPDDALRQIALATKQKLMT